jgi:hypothetical protein
MTASRASHIEANTEIVPKINTGASHDTQDKRTTSLGKAGEDGGGGICP